MITFKRITFGIELLVAVVAFGYASNALFAHVTVISQAQNVSIPMLASVSTMEQHKELLQAQVELTELEVVARNQQNAEHVQAYVLDSAVELQRAIAVLEGFTTTYTATNKLALRSPIRTTERDGATVLQFEADMHTDAKQSLQSLVELSGLYTVYDALSPEDRQVLIERTEAESPQAITELEDFFATPLLQYGEQTEAYIAALLRSFSGNQFSGMLTSIVSNSRLAAMQTLVDSDLYSYMSTNNAWPYPFITITDYTEIYSSVKDWQTVSITIILSS